MVFRYFYDYHGSLLETQAKRLFTAGVQRLNISLDSVEEEGFAKAVGRMDN